MTIQKDVEALAGLAAASVAMNVQILELLKEKNLITQGEAAQTVKDVYAAVKMAGSPLALSVAGPLKMILDRWA